MTFWSDEREFYRSPQWRELSAACIKRDGNRCTYVSARGIRCDATTGLSAHHIIPRSKNGADKLFNLKTVCKCHHEVYHPHMRKNTPAVTASGGWGATTRRIPVSVANLSPPPVTKYKANRSTFSKKRR